MSEILHGDGSGGQPMGIMVSNPPIEVKTSPLRLFAGLAMALAAMPHASHLQPNREKRRAERKMQRQARKRARK